MYVGLHALEPRPFLEESIRVNTINLLQFGPKYEQKNIHKLLLTPLRTAVSVCACVRVIDYCDHAPYCVQGLPVSPAYNEVLTSLSRRNETQQLLKVCSY